MTDWTNQKHLSVDQEPDPGFITPMDSDKLSHAEMRSHFSRGSSGSGTPLWVCLNMKGEEEDVDEEDNGCFPAPSAHMIFPG